ncbi:MAG: transglycosylase domain-containing protein, partial [Clostridia bacterium]|nr:transglycosylase domain-containing protein [Clostridia bacterium]
MNGNPGSSIRPEKGPVASSVKDKGKEKTPLQIGLKILGTVLLVALCLIFVIGSSLAGLVGGGVYGIIKTTPMLDASIFKTMGFNSYVYDADGNVIAELKKEENRVWINYEDIPPLLIKAYIAVEDKRFEEHKGIDFKRIGSAAMSYLKHMFNPNVDVQGGSTITQQLIKTLTKNDDVTIKRKIQEQWQAIQLEKVLTKPEIMTYYLNNVPMGGNFY